MVYDAERGENTGLAGLLVGGERGVQEVCDRVMFPGNWGWGRRKV